MSALTPTRESLERSSNTVTILHGKAYIFGGITSNGELASNDMHVISLPGFAHGAGEEYKCIPALGAEVPKPRANQAACVFGDDIIYFGGTSSDAIWADPDACLWVFSTTSLQWHKSTGPSISGDSGKAQVSHDLITSNGLLVLRLTTTDQSSTIQTQIFYTKLDDPSPSWSTIDFPPNNSTLRVVSAGSAIYALPTDTVNCDEILICPDVSVSRPSFFPIKIPSTTASTLPQTRSGNQILHISTGHGRHYLALLPGISSKFGSTLSDAPSYLTDLWTLQLPSDDSSLTKMKDETREKINLSSGEFTWSEVVIEAKTEEMGIEGKALPGPLAHYAADNVDGRTILMWGGVDGKGSTVGDGWLIKLE
jgi:hypothetical protein